MGRSMRLLTGRGVKRPLPNPRLEALFPLEAMGETAENIREATQISRERQDAFAPVSYTHLDVYKRQP